MPVRDDIYKTLNRYYQGRIHPYNRKFRLSPHYIRLGRRRVFAEANHREWDEFIAGIKNKFPGYDISDWTDYFNESGFYLALALHHGLPEDEVDKLFYKHRQTVRFLKIFVSFLGTYYFHYKFEIVPDTNPTVFHFSRYSVYRENYTEIEREISDFCDHFWRQRGYIMPDNALLSEPVTDMYYDSTYHKNLQVFNYLFDTSECIKTTGCEREFVTSKKNKRNFDPWSTPEHDEDEESAGDNIEGI
jgi:hypothetical protein